MILNKLTLKKLQRSKSLEIKSENINKYCFTFSDKLNSINYEFYDVDISSVKHLSKSEIDNYVKNYFKNMLDNFNNTLRPGESKRILKSVFQVEIKTILNKI